MRTKMFFAIALYLLFAVTAAVKPRYPLWGKFSAPELSCNEIKSFFDKGTYFASLALTYKQKMYRVMTSAYSIQRLAKKFTGNFIRSHYELSKACPAQMYGIKSGHFEAFGHKVPRKKYTTESGVEIISNKSNYSKGKLQERGKVLYFWTDESKYVCQLSCWGDGDHMEWVLHSTSKNSVPSEIKKILFRKLKEIGFNPRNAIDIPHVDCSN